MMATLFAGAPGFGKIPFISNMRHGRDSDRGRSMRWRWLFLAALVFFASIVVAQNSPQVTAVDPASGKVNDTVTVSGSGMGKAAVSAVYFSDDKNDYKTTIVEQNDDKITLKVPQVKVGDYNISLQVGDKLFIKPVKFKVQE
jgi:IPT/TIG domain